jgi:hypothetical protein
MDKRKYCCFKGRGDIGLASYAARLAMTAGFLPVGNASAFAINVTENTEEVPDYTSPSGGTACSYREIATVQVALSLRCHSPSNWAIATSGAGADTEVPKAAVTDEPHVLWPGTMEPLNHLVDDSVDVVVTSPDGTTTYESGRDYEITPAGSLKTVEGTTIPEPTIASGRGVPNINVSYTRRDQRLIQLYARPPLPVALHFDGYNVAADSPQATHFDLYRVVFGPAASVNVIGDNLAVLELTGSAERDTTKRMGSLTNPFSQYGTLRI